MASGVVWLRRPLVLERLPAIPCPGSGLRPIRVVRRNDYSVGRGQCPGCAKTVWFDELKNDGGIRAHIDPNAPPTGDPTRLCTPEWSYDECCRRCGGALRGKSGWYCGGRCKRIWNRNHDWNTARAYVLLRDGGHCVRCHHWTVDREGRHDGCDDESCAGQAVHDARPFQRCEDVRGDSYPAPHGRNVYHFGGGRHWIYSGPGSYHMNPAASDVKAAFPDMFDKARMLRSITGWEVIVQDRRAEVNHITPVDGRRESTSCKHHADNLELLCHQCHVEFTSADRPNQLRRMGYAVRGDDPETDASRDAAFARLAETGIMGGD